MTEHPPPEHPGPERPGAAQTTPEGPTRESRGSASTPPPSPRRRGLLTARPTRSSVLAGVLTLGLGLAISAQIHQTRDLGLESLRETELVGILDTVTARAARLEEERRRLEDEQARLSAGAAGGDEAVRLARRRIDDLGVLAGTVAAEGPGVTITLDRGQDVLTSASLLDLVEELRDAGAEAIQIGGVRVVASTSFVDRGGDVLADGQRVTWPLRVIAIGDARTLASALAIPGGVEESTRQAGATIRVDPQERVLVNALHAPTAPRYAREQNVPSGPATP